MTDERLGWRLELNNAVVAEVSGGSNGDWYASGPGVPPTGPFPSVRDAVKEVPALRSIPGPGDWELTTSVPTGIAALMLGEPDRAVTGVTVNGEFCQRCRGADRVLLMSDHCYEAEWDDLLTVATKSPGTGSFAGSPAAWWWATRYGPVCEFAVSEQFFDDRFFIEEDSDVAACERLLAMVEGYVTQLRGPVVDRGTQEDRARLAAAVGCSYGVLWVGGDLWVDDEPAPTDLAARLPTGSLRLYRDGAACLCGDLTATDQELPDAERWIAVVCRDADQAAKMLVADFASTDDEDNGQRDQVIVENSADALLLGHIIDEGVARAKLYAGAFGGVILQGAGTVIEELAPETTVYRRWYWASQPGLWPQALARKLPNLLA